MILGREPALILGALQAGLGLLIGLHVIVLTGDQVGLIMAFAAALAAVIVRQVVTPTAAPKLETGTVVTNSATGEKTVI